METPFSILIVEDDPENLILLKHLLRNTKYQLHHVDNGEDAVRFFDLKCRVNKEVSGERVASGQADLILMDIMLPGMDGIEACRQIKRLPNGLETTVVFMTANTSQEEKLKGFQAGGEDYVTKPFFKEELLARIKVNEERIMAQKKMKMLQASLRESNANLEQNVKERTKRLEVMHQKMLFQEKLASMGKLSAGLAHELNNPINFIRNNFKALENYFADISGLLKSYRECLFSAPSGTIQLETIQALEKAMRLDFFFEDIHHLFEESSEGFERISWVLSSMKNFSRKEELGPKQEVDVNKCILDTLTLSRNEYKYHTNIITNLEHDAFTLGYPQQIKQVILNLILNAAQAIGELGEGYKGEIHIKTRNTPTTIEIDIQDNAGGMPDAVLKQIFDPFFTTKPAGQGTGLGLALCYEFIVEKHQGTIQVESEEGKGTLFKLTLPRYVAGQ